VIELLTILFILVALKLPLVYVGWIVWWAIKAEPQPGEAGESQSFTWTPWRSPSGDRPPRSGPHGSPGRGPQAVRRQRKAVS
jgi:hypothetical protein